MPRICTIFSVVRSLHPHTWVPYNMISLDHCNYRESDIVLLVDDAQHNSQIPTKRNIRKAIRWLVDGARKHDALFFHCASVPTIFISQTRLSVGASGLDSGHGGQAREDDEVIKGTDDSIFPVDFKDKGCIRDDVCT